MLNWTDEQISAARGTVDNKEEVLALCLAHLDVFSKIFFPERFTLPFEKPHYQIIEALDDFTIDDNGQIHYPNKKIVIVCSRGGGKSSLLLAHKARKILFRLSRFSPWVGYSETHAIEWTENLKTELISSRSVRDFGFGSIKTAKFDLGLGNQSYDQQFSKKTWVASYPGDSWQTMVLPRGASQQMRGISFGPYRPDDPLFDDFENAEEIDNEDQRKKLRSKFYGSHLKCVPQHEGAEYQIVYVDTIKHEDALITHLLDDSSWVRVFAPLCDEDYRSFAPRFKSTATIKEEAAEYDRRGEIDTYAREVLCTPIARKSAAFQESYFSYYAETDEEFLAVRNRLRNVLIVDPAKTANMKSAYTALFVWGIDPMTNTMYARFCRQERLTPNELYPMTIDTALAYGCFVIAVEETGLNDFIAVPFMNFIIKSGQNLLYHPLKAKKGEGEFSGREGGKRGRIAQLVPYYQRGLIRHNRYGGDMAAYKLQLRSYPKSKYWDLMDCAAYINQIMADFDWFFGPDSDVEGCHEYERENEYKESDMSDSLADYVDPQEYFI